MSFFNIFFIGFPPYINPPLNLEYTSECDEIDVLFSIIVILNALMLFAGLSGELGWIKNSTAVMLGFIPFIGYFYLIHEYYAKFTKTGSLLFWIFTAIWSLYGFSALAPYISKNISYNILDLISKNFMEIYLSVVLLMVLRI